MTRLVLALTTLTGCVTEDIVASWASAGEGDWPATPSAPQAGADAEPAAAGAQGVAHADEPLPPPPEDPPPEDPPPEDPPPVEAGEGWLCACEDVVTSAALVIDGDLGAGGRLQADLGVTVAGDVTVSGPLGMNSGGAVDIGGDLRCAGALTSDGPVVVHGDAFIAGEIRVPRLEVTGMLTVLPDAPLTGELDAGALDLQEAGAEAFDIAPPCRCPQTVPPPGANADVRAAIPGPAELTIRLPGPWPAELYIEGAVTADVTLAPLDLPDQAPPAVDARIVVGGGLDAAPPVIAQEMPAESRVLLHLGGGEVLSFETPPPWPDAYRYDLIATEAELVVGTELTVAGRWQVRRVAADQPIEVTASAD